LLNHFISFPPFLFYSLVGEKRSEERVKKMRSGSEERRDEERRR
jgi:hypothetical protein